MKHQALPFKGILHMLWVNRFQIGYILLLFWIFWQNTFHTNFPDEFDNIVGGWYINRGLFPYLGFFSHHNPGAYIIASFITFFTKQSFVAFRIAWSIVLLGAALGGFYWVQVRTNYLKISVYRWFLFFLGISATYFWGHMILSETIVGYALVPLYALLIIKISTDKPITRSESIVISLASALALFTSFTFFFAVALLVGLTFWHYVKISGIQRSLLKVLFIFAAPYLVFGLVLSLTGSWSEFIYDSIEYNRLYYIYNFPTVAGQISRSPARYALSILYNNTMQFYALLTQVRNFNFSYPITLTFLLGNLSLLSYFLYKRKFVLAGFLYLFLVYLNARSEPLNSSETDFHSTVYFMISIFNMFYALDVWWIMLKEKQPQRQLLAVVSLLLVGVYGLFGGLFLLKGFTEKTYARFMGNAPAIYDQPVAAPLINKLVSKDEYFWIGPFEFQELLYINGKLPSKYHWWLPANARSDKIKKEITADLLQNRPKLIVFKEDYGAFGTIPKDFNYPIVDILREHYFKLSDLENEGQSYNLKITGLHNFDIKENFYFDKNRKAEIVKQLIDTNIIEPI